MTADDEGAKLEQSLNHRIDLPDVLAWITANDV